MFGLRIFIPTTVMTAKMVSYDKRRRVAELLRAVAAGRTTADEALTLSEQWDDIPWDLKGFDDASHALQHFKIDEEIRRRDEGYGTYQREGLYGIASALEEE